MKNDKKYRIIPYPSEHVVVDETGNEIVSCPTEQEAWEYVEEVLQGEAELSPFENRRQCERKNRSHEKNAPQAHSSNSDNIGDDNNYAD